MFGSTSIFRSSCLPFSGRSRFHLPWNNETVSEGLKNVYKEKLLPLEERHLFHEFHSAKLNDADFVAKPSILLMGQYSTGKTTLIKYLLKSEFPGMRIGPEPTTDKFMAIMYDEKTGIIPGNALVADKSKSFGPLAQYGNAFLTRFQCSTLKNQVLEAVTLIDTPGILSGEKQRVDRGYDFTGVLHWFAERVDRILLLFDAHKLDISDEFKWSIEALKGYDDKIRILLNKADMVDHQSLMRIYGSLMWSLGKVINTPEVPRVYVGSFWQKEFQNNINRQLFDAEELDLLKDIHYLPSDAVVRKINDLTKRARLAKVHAHIIDALKENMPTLFRKEEGKKKLIQNLPSLFKQLQNELGIPSGDFPDVKKMQETLTAYDFSRFNRIKVGLMEAVNEMLTYDITRLMAILPDEATTKAEFKVGILSKVADGSSLFGSKTMDGFNAGREESGWVVEKFRNNYDAIFQQLNPDENGRLNKSEVKEEFLKSKLPSSILSQIYIMADIDHDGFLDVDEFALAHYMMDLVLQGYDIPESLPLHLIPPNKRNVNERRTKQV